jgi:hypothetical protein
MEKYCIHDFLPGQCSYCRDIPFGLNSPVFRTQYAFHNWSNCEYLESGQNFAISKGGNATEIVSITLTAAFEKLYPCEWCCALYYSKGIDLEDCLVFNSEGSKPAKIIRDRYIGKNMREFQIYFPESGEIEIMLSRYVKRFK